MLFVFSPSLLHSRFLFASSEIKLKIDDWLSELTVQSYTLHCLCLTGYRNFSTIRATWKMPYEQMFQEDAARHQSSGPGVKPVGACLHHKKSLSRSLPPSSAFAAHFLPNIKPQQTFTMLEFVCACMAHTCMKHDPFDHVLLDLEGTAVQLPQFKTYSCIPILLKNGNVCKLVSKHLWTLTKTHTLSHINTQTHRQKTQFYYPRGRPFYPCGSTSVLSLQKSQ